MPDPLRSGPVRRWPYAVLAYLFTGLALVGVVVPGLPTFPFLLLAAWAAARGSDRLHTWLYEHPRFGAALIDWEREGAVSRRSKVLAIALMALSWLIMLWRVGDPWILTALAALFLTTGTYVARRPEPSSHHDDRHSHPHAASSDRASTGTTDRVANRAPEPGSCDGR
jgi:uncharacterized protein